MARAKNKTQPTTDSVDEHINAIEDSARREDCQKLIELMSEESHRAPIMWGSIVGFGQYHYRYESGREGDFMRVGFSNRKSAISIYIMSGFSAYSDLLGKLGKFKTGKSCLYVKTLADIDVDVLRRLVRESLVFMAKEYGEEA